MMFILNITTNQIRGEALLSHNNVDICAEAWAKKGFMIVFLILKKLKRSQCAFIFSPSAPATTCTKRNVPFFPLLICRMRTLRACTAQRRSSRGCREGQEAETEIVC